MYVRMKQRKGTERIGVFDQRERRSMDGYQKGPDMQQQRAEQSRTAYDMYVCM